MAKQICRSLKPLNPTVRVYSNLRRNMGRKPGDETFKHSIFTHFTKDWNWKVCNRTKITRTPCRKRTGTAIPRAENFGDLMTAKNKVLSDGSESWNNRRYSVVVQDLSTQWIQSYPRKSKTLQETERSLQKFVEPTRKHKVIYADNSIEFGKVCEDLSWNHCPSTPQRPQTNKIAERVELLQHCCNQIWMKMVGGFHRMFLLSAIQFKIPYLMGGHFTKGDSTNQLESQ